MTVDVERLSDSGTIRLLLAIEQHQTFVGAAKSLGVTQPSVSQQVRRLERHVGRPLFRRSRRGVEFTPSGRAVIAYIRSMLALGADLREHLEQHDLVDELTIGMAEDFCRTALATILWLFMADHPHVRIKVVSGTYAVLAEAIERKTVDFAIMRRFDAMPDGRVLWREQLAWIGRSGIALPLDQPVPLVLPLPPNPARATVIDCLRASGRRWFVRFESVGLAGMEAAFQAGLGICAAPRSMWIRGAGPLGRGHGLPDLPIVDFMLVLVRPNLNESARAFIEILFSSAEHGFTNTPDLERSLPPERENPDLIL